MLPTKLARAALRGKRCSVVPPDAVVALMRFSRSACGDDRVVPGGRPGSMPGSVSGSGCRYFAEPPGLPAAVHGVLVGGGASSPAAYVPTGYVPDGEVTGVAVSSRRRKVAGR